MVDPSASPRPDDPAGAPGAGPPMPGSEAPGPEAQGAEAPGVGSPDARVPEADSPADGGPLELEPVAAEVPAGAVDGSPEAPRTPVVRAGPGTSVDPGVMVDHVNRCPEVTTDIPKADRARVAWAFAVVTEPWHALGLVADGVLTPFGAAVLPAVLTTAWAAA